MFRKIVIKIERKIFYHNFAFCYNKFRIIRFNNFLVLFCFPCRDFLLLISFLISLFEFCNKNSWIFCEYLEKSKSEKTARYFPFYLISVSHAHNMQNGFLFLKRKCNYVKERKKLLDTHRTNLVSSSENIFCVFFFLLLLKIERFLFSFELQFFSCTFQRIRN